MSFYIKKGFNFGPLRINFSKSGIGLSVGGKGLRIGSGPKGNYIHAGRKGLYYRKNLPMAWTAAIIILAGIALLAYWIWNSGLIQNI